MNKIDLEAIFMEANVKPKDRFYSTVYGDIYFDGHVDCSPSGSSVHGIL